MADSILTRIRGLVAGKKATNSETREAEAAKPPMPQFGEVAGTDVLREERGLEGQSLFKGRVFVLDLEPFFEAIGSTTSRTANNLIFMCENVLSKRIGKNGAYSLYDDQIFMFRFEDEDDPEGWKKARAIVNEIGVNFFGESFKPNEMGAEVISEVDAAEVVDAVGDVHVDLIKKIVLPSWDPEEEAQAAAWDYRSVDRGERDPNWQEFIDGSGGKHVELDFRSEDIADSDPNWENMREADETGGASYKELKHRSNRVERAWEVQKYKKRPARTRVQRGPQRRTGENAYLYSGPERRKRRHGRRAGDDPRQVVW